MRVLARANQSRRLGIVNDDEILVELHALPVLLVVGKKYLTRGLRQLIRTAVQRVMESFRDLKEIVSSRDDIPVGGNLELPEQRDKAIQHFGDASADGSRIDHLYRLAFKFARQEAQFVELSRTDNIFVSVEWRRGNRCGRRLPRPRRLAAFRTRGRGRGRLPWFFLSVRMEVTSLRTRLDCRGGRAGRRWAIGCRF